MAVDTLATRDDLTVDSIRSMAEVLGRAHRIKEIQSTLMRNHVHYGVIPGTQKPTLYQPGADVLLVAFRIGPRIASLEDLSTDDAVRYRVTIAGINQVTGASLGEGIGECSTDEDRYRWRRAVCDEEWSETPADRRREKWAKGSGGKPYKTKQVRTNVADVANTCLKIAAKRAKVAMALNVTAASDVFQQDLEDLSEELRDSLVEAPGETPAPQPAPRIVMRDAEGKTASPHETLVATSSKPAPPPTGHIRTLHPRPGNALIVELDNGYVCSTRDATLVAELLRLHSLDQSPKLTLHCRASADPNKYAPILEELQVHDA